MNSFFKQRTLAMITGFERYTKKTRRAMFLEEMEQVVPWKKLCGLIEPHYPKPGKGRRPKELEQMLRIYFVQQWFNLADPAVEEALYDSATLRQFVGIDLGAEPVPDETTVCKFRHLLEEHHLGEEILGTVNLHLQAKGVRITTGTIVDATLIHAPSSTKKCAVKGAGLQRVQFPPGNWFAPPGSNRNGGGGNEAVGAFDVEGR